jgi:hypothetical protein
MGPAKKVKPAGESDAQRKAKVVAGNCAANCAICGQPFGKTSKPCVMKEHWELKHESKKMHTLKQCFPTITFE